MATKKRVRIKTASQLETDGWTLEKNVFEFLEYRKDEKSIPSTMFQFLGQEITGVLGKEAKFDIFDSTTWDATLTTWTSLPGLDGIPLVMSSGTAYLTFWDDNSMDVDYKGIYIQVDTANLEGLRDLLNTLPW